jgi:hypothetical protein
VNKKRSRSSHGQLRANLDAARVLVDQRAPPGWRGTTSEQGGGHLSTPAASQRRDKEWPLDVNITMH